MVQDENYVTVELFVKVQLFRAGSGVGRHPLALVSKKLSTAVSVVVMRYGGRLAKKIFP